MTFITGAAAAERTNERIFPPPVYLGHHFRAGGKSERVSEKLAAIEVGLNVAIYSNAPNVSRVRGRLMSSERNLRRMEFVQKISAHVQANTVRPGPACLAASL